MLTNILVTVSCFLILNPGALPDPASAQGVGDLMVTPTRIVLEGRERTAEVTLLNQGTERATYRITFRRMRMTETGKLEEITDTAPEGMYADEFVRYSPRQVDLQPGESQVVRLLVRKPPDLRPGEYRSHLLFRAVPPEDAGADIEQLQGEGDGISIRLIPVFGISIPVIVRHGALEAAANVTDIVVHPASSPGESPMLDAIIERMGDESLYGDLQVEFMRDSGGKVEVGQLRGVAVYTPLGYRLVQMKLSPPEGVQLRGGHLRVAYHASDDSETVLAEAEVYIP